MYVHPLTLPLETDFLRATIPSILLHFSQSFFAQSLISFVHHSPAAICSRASHKCCRFIYIGPKILSFVLEIRSEMPLYSYTVINDGPEPIWAQIDPNEGNAPKWIQCA